MIDAPATGPRGRREWRIPALVGASLAVHVVLLGSLALGALGFQPDAGADEPPLVLLQIEPRPMLPDERTRLAVEASAADAPRHAPDDEDDAPAAPAPRLAAAPPAGVPSPPADPWRVAPENPGDRIAAALRSSGAGCRLRGPDLTAAERARCDERLGQAARSARPITGSGDPARDARFAAEGARATARYEARRAPLAGGVGVVGPADCVGSNFGTGCAGGHLDPSMRQGAGGVIRQDSNKLD